MTPKNLLTLSCILLLTATTPFSFGQTVTYQESSEDFMNPDRGFYTPSEVLASQFEALNVEDLRRYRTQAYTPYQGNYTVRTSLVFRHYVLDAFVNTNTLSSNFLHGVAQDFLAARQAGVRLILRFSYTTTYKNPPYGDAPKARVLAHIAQLKPLLQQNSDVIAVVQSGFIGTWGEQYYTDHFGDASKNGKLTDQNWTDRLEVLNALLDAVPANRMIQVRYPQMKQKLVYGIHAPVISPVLNEDQAFKTTSIARIGFHNDCFLSAPDDTGTYWDYGTTSTSASDQTVHLKQYAANDSKYIAVGGETCSDAFSPQNDCSGITLTEMDELNYSFLNADYNNAVNNDWQTQGCMEAIKRWLGYRFVMRSGTFPATVATGQKLSFVLEIQNVGFTAPFNERALELILRNTTNNQEYKIPITGPNSDARFWSQAPIIQLNPSLVLPSTIPTGTYSLLLHLVDKSGTGALANRPEYSIRMANENTWEATTGYNRLNHTLNVTVSTNVQFPASKSSLVSKVYPNPTSGLINIEYHTESASREVFFEVSTASGTLVFQKKSKAKGLGNQVETLDLSHLNAGIYILKVKSGSTTASQLFSIIK